MLLHNISKPVTDNELLYRIAFAGYRGINRNTAATLAAKHVSPADFFTSPASELGSITTLNSRVFADERRREALESARRELDFVRANNIRAIFYTDPDYPERLQFCDDAPAMIFVLGRANLNVARAIAVVGTRHCTAYGADFTRRLVEEAHAALGDELLVVSGLAYGIDVAAHQACLSGKVTTGAILAHGLNTMYPANHRDVARRILEQGGFLATEYGTGVPIHRANFLARNRIVAGITDATIVVESDLRGGAMTTAAVAMAYNREVLAVPGRVYDPESRGCNALIARRQASIIRGIDDLLEVMGWTALPQLGEQQNFAFELTPEQQQVVDYLRANPTATVNDMCMALGIPYSRLSGTLFEMEMADIIVATPGNRYAVIEL